MIVMQSNIKCSLHFDVINFTRNCFKVNYMKYSQASIIRTSIVRKFRDQNLVRPSTADNRGLTVIT